MICGIDLGTTYSLIGHGDELYSSLVASAVDLSTGQQVSFDVISKDVERSYKTDMTVGEPGELSRKCSAVVLKKLAKQASERSGQTITDVIISVPAKFTATQRDATWESAKLAGLNPVALINEPTAAAIYACKEVKDLVVVFDLGGGTFDVTILDARAGMYCVIATDGNSHLGGDDLDKAIADNVCKACKVPIFKRTKTFMQRLTNACRQAKENITTFGETQYIVLEDADINYTLTKDEYIDTMKQVFASALDLTKYVISSNLLENDPPKLLFVGGSTADKYLREWIKKELELVEFEIDCNPSYIVAKGVATYAEMYERGRTKVEVSDVTSRIAVEMENHLTETVIEANSIIPIRDTITVQNSTRSRYATLNFYQGDSKVANQSEYIGTMEFDLGEEKEPNTAIIDVDVEVGQSGRLKIVATDIVTNREQEIILRMR